MAIEISSQKLKQDFLEQYGYGKIRIQFNYKLFIADNAISINYREIPLSNFKSFYTPWHQKDGKICGAIEEVLEDNEYRTVKVEEALEYPEKNIESNLPKKLDTIPLLVDKSTGKTLVLDSNHTILRALSNWPGDTLVSIIEVSAPDAALLTVDFKVIKRI